MQHDMNNLILVLTNYRKSKNNEDVEDFWQKLKLHSNLYMEIFYVESVLEIAQF